MHEPRSVRAPGLAVKKQRGEKITMIAVYDATMAQIFDQAGVDVLLVGDSLGMTILGYDTTVPVTLDDVVHHAKAVSRTARRALVVADMPFLSWRISNSEAVHGVKRLMQEGGASAVKIEGGASAVPTISHLVESGVPVMGHLGLTPQSVHQFGGFKTQAKNPDAQQKLIDDALALEEAGVFAIVLECIPADLARRVTSQLRIPTIGIGAGPHCDGQVLVSYDMLGLFENPPPFAKQYARLRDEISRAAAAFVEDVKSGEFPQ
ncbi:MAG TPA: 3-methyl-2-oxobutanoate hydroxymethyltransferase [Bryobacteraceae bacterium]|nr:3-methyl-2-oxobutanoate hydroxymethyltransferase [Bryobacteraceae bacterium]